ncbi:GntR family transcriptional regulator of abcA and norABC [Paenibacillus phyllosphaerae]|uniref:GntR family transcriptional regulator of abcA and norABC n=1 Tax=Paenibacillus phyllosphaerae TaxID=274593 RepID=A0A7W5AYU1_9BACL|nr:PLP-dependent aminotransferase family protein [Paenibacillus phyllosphaerae]MBB3111274.1 GntR family transcriptional regulator of abcA and norABC [Paenibacillus phyllosphaerae]
MSDRLDWFLDRSSPEPLHMQLVRFVKSKIEDGEWSVGMRIPSQRDLAANLKVNRSTVVAAIEELTAMGLLEGRAGGGTYVVNTTWSVLAAKPPLNWLHYVEAGNHRPNLKLVQDINEAEFQPGIIRLGTGELSSELLPQRGMQQILSRLSQGPLWLGYEEGRGNARLRQAIAEHMGRAGIHGSASSILIVSGALQALQLIAMGLLERGSTVLIENPSYANSIHVFQAAGMQVSGIPMDDEGLRASLLPHYRQQTAASLLYTIPSFHNPTGTVMTDRRRSELAQICRQERLPIIEDDVYRDLWFDAPPPAPLKARDPEGMVLYVGSFSKTVSPGLRIGWITGPEPVIARLADIKMQTDYGASSLSQMVAEEWLRSGAYEAHLAELRLALRARRDRALQLLEQYCGGIAQWNKPQGGFYIWMKLSGDVPMVRLFELARQEGILLNPGIIYDRHTSQHLRISYAYATAVDLEYGIRTLSGLIRTLLRGPIDES